MKMTLPKEWYESKLPDEEGHEIGAGCPAVPCSASDDYTPPFTYRRLQFSCTLDVWALPLCITRYKCGGVAIQFLCFEVLTDRAHRWPNMTTSEFIEQVICAAKRDHKARKTWQCYAGWARRYAHWLRSQPGLHASDSETKVSRYLAHLATRPGGCSPKTQQQAPNIIPFARAA